MASRKNSATSADNKLKKLIDLVPEERKPVAERLASEIGFMSRTLEALKAAVDEEGPVDSPALKSYNVTVQRYGTICKQFVDMLPKPEQKNAGSALYNFIRQG